MIPFDFEYYKPNALREAVILYSQLEAAGKGPVYYGGGSELISMARVGNLAFGAVIDIKGIPECRALYEDGENIVFGAALTLSEIIASKKFGLLAKTAGRIADHTMQNKITLGGNLASSIVYRETVLPLLLADAGMTAADVSGAKSYSIHEIFNERLRLPKGELFVLTSVSKKMAQAPFFHEKKTKNEKIDYPLITTAALVSDGLLRIAFSGLAAYPFRDMGAEKILNDRTLDSAQRACGADAALSGIIQSDLNGSAEYRRFVLKKTVINILESIRTPKYHVCAE